MSSILFNLAIEPVIRALHYSAPQSGYPLHDWHFSVVAYDDDLALIASGEQQMTRLLQITEEAWAGLKFNARKCASLDGDCTKKRRVLPTDFRIGGAPMVSLDEGQDIQKIEEDLKKIDESLLAKAGSHQGFCPV